MKRTITREYDTEGRLVKETVVEEQHAPVAPVLPGSLPIPWPGNSWQSTSGTPPPSPPYNAVCNLTNQEAA